MKLRLHYTCIALCALGILVVLMISLKTRSKVKNEFINCKSKEYYLDSRFSMVFDQHLHADTIYLNNTYIKIPTHQVGHFDRDYKNYSYKQFTVGCPHLWGNTDKDFIAVKQICNVAGCELGQLLDSPNFVQRFLLLYSTHVFDPTLSTIFGKTVYLKPENNSKSIVKAVKLNDAGLVKQIYLNNGETITFKSKEDSTYVGAFRSSAKDIDTQSLFNNYYSSLKHICIFPPSDEKIHNLVRSHINEAILSLKSDRFYAYPQGSDGRYLILDKINLPYWLHDIECGLFLSLVSILIIAFISLRKRKKYIAQINLKLENIKELYPKCSLKHNLPDEFSDWTLTSETESLINQSETLWLMEEESLVKHEKEKLRADEIRSNYPNGYNIVQQRFNLQNDLDTITNSGLIEEEENNYRTGLYTQYTASQHKISSAQNDLSESVRVIKDSQTVGDLDTVRSHIDISRSLLTQIKEEEEKQADLISQIKSTIRNSTLEQSCRYGELTETINELSREFDNSYTRGISIQQEKAYINYNVSGSVLIQNEHNWQYPCVRYPSHGTIVFPYRRRRLARRGYTEDYFEGLVRKQFESDRFDVIGDANILLTEGCRPYEPDIAIIEKDNNFNIRIDIEIDEPYSGLTKQPTHYIGCGDYTRDMNIISAGWIVIRFCEEAIVRTPNECLAYIARVIDQIISDYERPESLRIPIKNHKRWSEIEAKIMAANNFRESYLGIEAFGNLENRSLENIDILHNQTEREAYKEIKAHFIPNVKSTNLDHSRIVFANDKHLTFEPTEHTYIYDGTLELRAVSNIIEIFFDKFDAIGNAIRMGKRDGLPPEHYLELWDRKGCLSREVGTFLHQQIEKIIRGKTYKDKCHFCYNGETEIISIQKEIDFFNLFIENHNISPFRTEWAICDLDYRVAGTIDCLCKVDDVYEIYDWKRSAKIVDYTGDPITYNSWGHMGHKPISHIHDTSYWRYALQQNIYKFILEKNYGIKISAMKILVLHPDYDEPYLVAMPNLEYEVIQMLEHLKNRSL